MKILSGNTICEKIPQTIGVPQGQCLSPHLNSLFTAGLPSTLHGPDVCTFIYADDLAICSPNLKSLQNSVNNLATYCEESKLSVNVNKTKAMKFRLGGRLCKNDVISYKGENIEFVSKFTYLGVVLQTKGGFSEHIEHLKNKGIAACIKIVNKLPINMMSLNSLERLFNTVVLPSASYGLRAISQSLGEEDYKFLTTVQGRLIKMWWGVSKYAPTSVLLQAAGWSPIGPLYAVSGSSARVESTHSHLKTLVGRNRRTLGLWTANGFHELWCNTAKCYRISDSCICKFCGDISCDVKHILKGYLMNHHAS